MMTLLFNVFGKVKGTSMNRSPIFPVLGNKTDTHEFIRNYWCPHYDMCLNEAAEINRYLDCSSCAYKNIQKRELRFARNLP